MGISFKRRLMPAEYLAQDSTAAQAQAKQAMRQRDQHSNGRHGETAKGYGCDCGGGTMPVQRGSGVGQAARVHGAGHGGVDDRWLDGVQCCVL